MPAASDELQPPIADRSGYRIRERDLDFLALHSEHVDAWRRRTHPLGLTGITYPVFKAQLCDALLSDGLSLEKCNVRLKGSAAEFFSGPHKPMPRTRQDIVRWFHQLRGRTPDPWELDEIVDRLDRRWLTDGEGPAQRPFDAMHRLGIDTNPSDLDVQLSSTELVDRCKAILAREGLGIAELTVSNPAYGFVQRYLVEKAAPNMYRFGLHMADRLGRSVSVAVFASCGPAELPGDPLSSHFRETDWMLDVQTAGHEESAA